MPRLTLGRSITDRDQPCGNLRPRGGSERRILLPAAAPEEEGRVEGEGERAADGRARRDDAMTLVRDRPGPREVQSPRGCISEPV